MGGRPIEYILRSEEMCAENSEFEKIKLKFDAIWKARRIEMEAFNSRTLYIWGFLALCYGAYAYLLYQAVAAFLLNRSCILSHPVGAFHIFNGLMMVVAIGIFVISILWICMIKGANAWAERTDWAAESYSHHYLKTTSMADSCCSKASPNIKNSRNCKICKGNPCHACLLGLFPKSSEPSYFPQWDLSLLSHHGGIYSPNKICLIIAQMSMLMGFILTFCNACIFCVPFHAFKSFAYWLSCNSWIVGAIPLALLIIVPVINCLKKWVVSHLESMTLKDDMAVFNAIRGDLK